MSKNPMHGRSPVVAVAVALFVELVGAAPARAEAPRWTEAEVVRRARAHSAEVAVADAEIAVAEAEEIVVGLLENPDLGWDREQLLGDGSAGQDILRLSLPIDLSGRPAARRSLAAAGSAGLRSEAAEVRGDAIATAVLAFHAALVAERREEISEAALAALDEAARVLARREQAGTASGFERARLEIEAELARSQLEERRASTAIARAVLFDLIAPGLESEPSLVGALSTDAPASEEALVARALRARASLGEAREAEKAVADARSSAGRWWMPGITLSAGALGARGGGETDYGYVAGLSIGLPLFSRGQDLDAEAAARGRLASARADAIARRLRREVVTARRRLVSMRAELTRFEAATTTGAELLRRGAASGYREGERSLVELLDAQRAAVEVELRRLELAAAAKVAEVELRRATGELR